MVAPPSPAVSDQPARRAAAPVMSRPARLVEREAPYLIAELKRVAFVSGTCIGLLALLVVIDRMQ